MTLEINEVCKNAAQQEIINSRVEAQRQFWAIFETANFLVHNIIYFYEKFIETVFSMLTTNFVIIGKTVFALLKLLSAAASCSS